ncbi:hypothetical protein V6Z11_A06G212100 [Gossypium hirsutum]
MLCLNSTCISIIPWKSDASFGHDHGSLPRFHWRHGMVLAA